MAVAGTREREAPELGDLQSRTADAWDREEQIMQNGGDGEQPPAEPAPTGGEPGGEEVEPEAVEASPRGAEDEPEAGESPAAEAGGQVDTDYHAEFLKSYGGDQQKAARHAIEMRNHNAKLTRELKELREGRSAPARDGGGSPRQRPQAEEVPPDIAELNNALDSMVQTYNASEHLLDIDRKELEATYAQLRDVRSEIEDPGPKSDIEELQWKARRLETKAGDIKAKVDKRDGANQSLWDRHQQLLERRHDRLEIHNLRTGERARTERDQTAAEAARDETTRRDFYDAAEKAAKQLDMPDQLREKFIGKKGYARKSALAHLVPNPDGSYPEIADYAAFCMEAGKEFMGFGQAGHEAHSATYTRLKGADTSLGVPPSTPGKKGGTPPKPGTAPRLPTLEDLEAEEEQRWDNELSALTAARRR